MDMGKSVFGVIGLAVMVLLVASLAVPAVEDIGYGRDYSTQEGLAYFDEGEFVLAFADSTLTSDGVTLTPAGVIIMASETAKIQRDVSTGVYTLCYLDGTAVQQVTLGDTWTATLDGNVLSVDNGGTDIETTSRASETLHITGAEGEFIEFTSGSVYANDGVRSYFTGVNASFISWFVTSDVSSGQDVGVLNKGTEVTATWTATTADGRTTVTSPTFTYNASSSPLVGFVSAEYYTLVEGSGTNAQLISIIPLMLFIVCLMAAVRLLSGRE